MKHTIIPEQHWIHEPDAEQLKRDLQNRDRMIVLLLVIALVGWSCWGLCVLASR